ncbi:MAG: hypothetical protein D4R64_06340 [Porphyromonadaceae bacterium]|nr:MAG: hypothetical protein D4R64_06340 [Porphyromonadaceae bacterium]
MKKNIGLLVLGGLFLSACEENPVIQTDGFQTKPVIYSIIDSEDSVHFIRLGRFFSGVTDPAETARIPDSIYFRSANLKVTLLSTRGTKINVPVENFVVSDKDSGMFNSDSFGVFRFEKKLVVGEYPLKALLYDSVFIEVNLPGLPVAKCSTSLVWPPRIWSPFGAQQFIYIYPDNPMRVLWSGDAWNEIDVSFKIMEQFPDTTVTQTFYIQKTNDIHWNGKYYEIKIPYELIVQILDQNLKVRSDVIRRYFGPFRIDILTGNQDFDIFMKFREGINDFNYNPFFNVDNGIGMLSGKSSTIKTALYLDQASRLKFAVEPSLRKFRFIEY